MVRTISFRPILLLSDHSLASLRLYTFNFEVSALFYVLRFSSDLVPFLDPFGERCLSAQRDCSCSAPCATLSFVSTFYFSLYFRGAGFTTQWNSCTVFRQTETVRLQNSTSQKGKRAIYQLLRCGTRSIQRNDEVRSWKKKKKKQPPKKPIHLEKKKICFALMWVFLQWRNCSSIWDFDRADYFARQRFARHAPLRPSTPTLS